MQTVADHGALAPSAGARIIGVLCELWCWLGPLAVLAVIVRLTAARNDSFLRRVTAEVLNLQVAALIPSASGFVAVALNWWAIAVASWIAFAIVAGYGYVVGAVGAVRAWRGDVWRYPVNLRLVPS